MYELEEKGIDWNLISSNTHSSLEISMQGRLKSQPDMHTTSFNSVTSSQSSVDAIDS